MRGWTHLERQKGGIGLRGPGETQLETDRRIIGAARARAHQAPGEDPPTARDRPADARAEIPVPSLALVGYTNAGKSTLFRALTGNDAYIADQLFATLDPTVRRIVLPGGTPVVAADTVGFIRELPHELVAAFQSTLHRSARGARCCCTWSMPAIRGAMSRSRRSMRCCEEIGAREIPQLRVYNKIDRLEASPRIDRDCRWPCDGGVDLRRAAAWVWIC